MFHPQIEIITYTLGKNFDYFTALHTKIITKLPDSKVIAYLIISLIHFGVMFLLQQNVQNCPKPLKMEWLLHPN